ncbi:DUF3467 domain-containing protein [Nocardia gipuzkoensis]|uniref:DUF3467 domain-containing protein n=1 Tax=Nocardia gipuzkoensis TaxID=2749991 RepID=UPI00237E1367|nr:DUF3467 domain-containing protein [Nocardia gipuzkoensis]MDE1675451.1 DUF3467 domain-containing protein [Nocardia gipuzkoensis]
MSDDPNPTGPPEGDIDVEVIVPDPWSAGVYANGFTCWYNRTDFTLDFLVYLPAEPAAAGQHGPVMRQPVQVTARVKFPPALIFRLMRTLDEAMSNYEHQFGHITSLGD